MSKKESNPTPPKGIDRPKPPPAPPAKKMHVDRDMDELNLVVTFGAPRVYRICSSCSEEFQLDMASWSSALPRETVNCIAECPHCGARNDVWIRVAV